MKARIPIACTSVVAAFSFVLVPGAMSAAPMAGSRAAPPAHTMTAPPSRATQPTTLGPTRTGQPSQECGSPSAPNTPGNSAQAPGSAFNPDGRAGTVYAGEQPQNSRNTASVSQYDTACAHQRR